MSRNLSLKIAFLRSGRRQSDVAAEIGLHESQLSRIVNGLECSDETKALIAAALGMEVSDLWAGHDAASDHDGASSNAPRLERAA